MQLFRQEVIEAKKQKLHGEVFLTSPVSFLLITLSLILFVSVISFLVARGSYARTEFVPGYLVPSNGIVNIQAGRFRTLTQLNVREGQYVSEGDPIVSIDAAEITTSGASVAARSINSMSVCS